MKKISILSAILFSSLFFAQSAFAVSCNESRDYLASSECWDSVTVASNETTLVSAGTVLVYDVSNAVNNATYGAFQVRVADASADGVFVAGVAQKRIASGETALILVRGKGQLKTKSVIPYASGNALFVSTSGDATTVTSTTQTQLGFALDDYAASGNTSQNIDAYITVL